MRIPTGRRTGSGISRDIDETRHEKKQKDSWRRKFDTMRQSACACQQQRSFFSRLLRVGRSCSRDGIQRTELRRWTMRARAPLCSRQQQRSFVRADQTRHEREERRGLFSRATSRVGDAEKDGREAAARLTRREPRVARRLLPQTHRAQRNSRSPERATDKPRKSM